MQSDILPYRLRYRSDDKKGNGSVPEEFVSDDVSEEAEKYICCAQCLQPITRPADRMIVNGSHMHTFANPSGVIYEIGCFHSVRGCGHAGPATGEFTWFKGYSWKVTFCGKCLLHLGWLFISVSGGDSFNGLILDRLIEPD